MIKITDLKRFKELQEELTDAREGKSTRTINEILEDMRKVSYFEEKKEDEVLKVIGKINDKYTAISPESYPSDFLQGGCYYFAHMLKELYKEKASIYIETCDAIHAIVKIGDKFYDATGVVDGEGYIETDEEQFKQFIDFCYINKDEDIIKSFEARCDAILEEIKEEMNQNKEKTSKIS